MKKYVIENAEISVEEKTFIDSKGVAYQYKEYNLLLTIGGNTLSVKLDKSDKKKIETLIDLGILK